MPNVTITVPEELKVEMDKFSEVSWSEICRNAITQYITQRENPNPLIELDLLDLRLENYHASGYPTLTGRLKIHNRMNTEIIIDRTLYEIIFDTHGHEYIAGSGFDLNRRIITSNSIGQADIFLPLFKEKLEKLKDAFDSTFPCKIQCTVIVNDFRNPYYQEVRGEIAIDKWNQFTKKALETNQAT